MNESNILGVSVRAWIAVILVLTTSAMSLMKLEIGEPLKSLVFAAVAFYFGARNASSNNSRPVPPS